MGDRCVITRGIISVQAIRRTHASAMPSLPPSPPPPYLLHILLLAALEHLEPRALLLHHGAGLGVVSGTAPGHALDVAGGPVVVNQELAVINEGTDALLQGGRG